MKELIASQILCSSRLFLWPSEVAYPVVSRQDTCSCQIFLEGVKGGLVHFFSLLQMVMLCFLLFT